MSVDENGFCHNCNRQISFRENKVEKMREALKTTEVEIVTLMPRVNATTRANLQAWLDMVREALK
jgi:FMN-dependent NADH-azoreductase